MVVAQEESQSPSHPYLKKKIDQSPQSPVLRISDTQRNINKLRSINVLPSWKFKNFSHLVVFISPMF